MTYALCFGAVPGSVDPGRVACISLPADADAACALHALNECPDKDRVCVLSGDDGAEAAWRFAAEFYDCIAGVAILSDGGCHEDIARVKSAPVLTHSAAARILRGEGNESVSTDADLTDWLCARSMALRQEVVQLQPGLWNINAGLIDSFYLIQGRDRALCIDTGMGERDVMPLLSRLTPLPVDLAATHVHGDHILHADEFETCYMAPEELPLLEPFVQMMMPEKGYTPEKFTPVREGDIIDLGGNRIEVIALPGHTPGSVCFVDHVHRAVFTGDAIGSGIGVLMAVPGAGNISEYRESLIRFRERIAPVADYAFYGGHRIQEKGTDRLARRRNPLCPELVDDMIALCGALLSGGGYACEIQSNPFVDEEVHYVTLGRAAMWVNPSRIR